MALRNSVVPAALALAGCLPTESEAPPALEQLSYETAMEGGECEVERVTYRVHGTVSTPPRAEKSRTPSSTLLVKVAETSSVVDCRSDIVKVATPGAELASRALETLGDSEFNLDVPGVIIGGQRPSIWVGAVLDANDNGECDPGELSGSVVLDEQELGDLAIELADEGCPARQ